MKLSQLKITDMPVEGKLYSIWLNEQYYELGDDGDTLIATTPSLLQLREYQRVTAVADNQLDGKPGETIRRLE
jgi:hypothetical protein